MSAELRLSTTRAAPEGSGVKVPSGVKLPIYFDNHATTPLDPRVLEEMLPYFREKFGNAASRSHAFGWAGEEAVETARERVARLIGASKKEIIFTSGATEADNLAIKGVAERYREKGNHIVTCVTEHKAVLDTLQRLEQHGYRVTYLAVEKDGLLALEELQRALEEKTILVSIMAANNEIGVLQPITEIGRLCHERGVIFHSDAAQAVGKIPLNVNQHHLDLASISAHKMHGPKGVGALYVRDQNPTVELTPILDGGGHERGLRSGTLNVPGIVGLGKACAIYQEEMPTESCRLAGLRNRLQHKITSRLDQVTVNGSTEHRLPANLNLSFGEVDGESLLLAIDDIAFSSGSACSSARREASHVLKALGIADELAHSSIRFGLGRFTTEAEVDYVADRVVETVER
jgi:cysteine desulfurase